MKPSSPGPTEFYLRKRRLAFLFAGLSVALLAVNLLVGLFLASYSKPRVAGDLDGLRFVWTSRNHDEESSLTCVLGCDLDLRPRGPAAPLAGDASAVLAAGDETLLFFGARYAVVKGGSTVRGASLEQPWAVNAAVRDGRRGVDWFFGRHEERLVARRRELGAFSETMEVAAPASPERITACVDGDSGPLVAWRERGSALLKFAIFDGRRFVPRGEVRIGSASHWDAALAGPRVLVVSYDREDRTFGTVGLRVRCCEGCPAPLAPALLRLGDPTLFLGKLVTGVATAAAGDRLALFVTRQTSAQAAVLPLDGLHAPAPRLKILYQEPRWRHMAGFLFPFTMLFFSFSLVSLGFTLLRERHQFILEKLTPIAKDGPTPAAILQRAMAYILDLLVALPIFAFVTLTLDLAPEVEPTLADAGVLALLAIFAGIQLLLHLVQELAFGGSVGKKIVGLRVVAADGSRLGWRGALLRNLARPLDASFPLGMFLGMSVLMATPRRQRLGDLAAKTMVIEDRPGYNPRP
jgi:uncharacterized RDD family membrane protein YckC